MSERLNEHWSRFLDGELSAAEQQWLLDEISRGERLPHDPLADAETHGMLAVMSQVACEDEDTFTDEVMRRLQRSSAADLDETQRWAATETLESLDLSALESSTESPVTVAPKSSAPAAISFDGDEPTRTHWATGRVGALVAAVVAAAVVGVIWVSLPERNAVQRPIDEPQVRPDVDPKTPVPKTPQPPDLVSPEPNPDSDAMEVIDDGAPALKTPSATLPPQGLAHQPTPPAPSEPEPKQRPAPYPQPAPIWTIKDVHSQIVKWASPLPRDIEGKTLQLLEGSARLVFGEVGEMTIHAPAKFRPEDSKLVLQYGRLMARAQAPMTIQTPATGIEIIDRANVAADQDGTAVTAIGPVGILPDKADAEPLAVPPGQFKWIGKTGHIYDWMVGMLEAEGVMTLLVNGELFQLNPVTAANPALHVQEYLVMQMRSRPSTSDFRGVLLINGKSYSYDGMRGVASAGRRLTSQLQQRRKAAAAAGVRLNINGVELADGTHLRVGGGQIQVAPSVTPNTASARSAADELLNRQQQMIRSMKQAFDVDLSGAERAVEQARQRIHQALPVDR